MTKEEIAKKHIDYLGDKGMSKVYDAMEEYAKQFTKDFVERISKNPITCYSQKFSGQEKQFFLGADYVKRLMDALK